VGEKGGTISYIDLCYVSSSLIVLLHMLICLSSLHVSVIYHITSLFLVVFNTYPSSLNLQRFVHTMRAIQGALIVASFLNIVIGYSKAWGTYSR